MKDKNLSIKETQCIPSRISKMKSTPRSTDKTIEHQRKEIFESARGKITEHLWRKKQISSGNSKTEITPLNLWEKLTNYIELCT